MPAVQSLPVASERPALAAPSPVAALPARDEAPKLVSAEPVTRAETEQLSFPITLAQATEKPWYVTYSAPVISAIDSILIFSGSGAPASAALTGQMTVSPSAPASVRGAAFLRPAVVAH